MLVFAYGTLRKGARNAMDVFVNAEYVGEDAVNGSLYDLGWYPGYSSEPGYGPVSGDIFKVTPAMLARLDEYEGVPHLYHRKRVETLGGHEVFIYEYNGELDPDELIVNGDWLSDVREKEKEQ